MDTETDDVPTHFIDGLTGNRLPLADHPWAKTVVDFLQHLSKQDLDKDIERIPFEIEAAILADREGRRFELKSVANVIRSGKLSAVSSEHRIMLADYLERTHRGKKGHKINHELQIKLQIQDDIDIALLYTDLINSGMARKDVLANLSHTQRLDVRNIEKAIQRAKVHIQGAIESNDDPFR